MREGLRSGKLDVKDGGNSGERCEEHRLGSDSKGEKVTHLASGGPETERESSGLRIGGKNGELDNEGFEEGSGGGGGGGSGKVGVADSVRKRKQVDGGEEIGNGDIVEKKAKEEVKEVNDKPPVYRRALRSRAVVNGGEEIGNVDIVEKEEEPEEASDKLPVYDRVLRSSAVVNGGEEIDNVDIVEKKEKEEVEEVSDKLPVYRRVLRSSVVMNGGCSKVGSEGVLDQKSSGADGCEKKLVEERKGKCDELVNKLGGKLKRKRGRPPLAKNIESDGSGSKELKVTRGRPCKVEKEEHGSLASDGELRKRSKGKRGRGRPRKVQEGNGALKRKRGKPLKVQESSGVMKRKLGRPPKVQDRNGALRLKLGRACKVEKPERSTSESDGRLNKKLKPEHGRHVKVQEGNEVLKGDDDKEGEVSAEDKEHNPLESDGLLKKKLTCKPGRPRKPGRPPKMQESNGVLKGDGDKEEKVSKENKRDFESQSKTKQNVSASLQESNGGDVDKDREGNAKEKGGLEMQERTKQNVPAYFSYLERVLIGKELNMRRFPSTKEGKNGADSETRENDGLSDKISKTVYAVSLKNQKVVNKRKITTKDKDVEPGKRMVKQSVRDKIVEVLLTAGWTIERRPRAERQYLDAVYVTPQGHTHWSVTKAYKYLKKHYENGDGESKVYKTGFKFIPIPEEELSILTKVIVKRRMWKKKLMPTEEDCGRAYGNVLSKKKFKKKLVGKSQRGRTKGKSLLPDHKNSAKHKGMPVVARNRKQHCRRNGKRPTLLVRNSMEEADSDADGYIPYAGKRTVLAWMIDSGTVSLNEKVQYMNYRKTRALREGRITKDGIYCDCCSETLTTLEFEIHAGSRLCEPFKNICLESGTSLLQCLLDSWTKQHESEREGFLYLDVNGEDPNDDACGICGDGGDLICCDGCPSTFHQSCLDIQKFPSGDWHCVYCSCKFCWMAGRNECQEDDNDNLAASELLTCQFCEEKYHRSCSKAKDAESVYSNSSFCGKKCEELFKKLKILLGVKHDLEEGFSWTLARRADIDPSISLCDIPQKCDIAQEIECNSKLAVALSLMDECFLPLVDNRSGVNLIHNIVYNCGSNFNRLNYRGFFTAILERGDEMVCAASIRIHGDQLAEMPFIGTRYMYRRQGMCRRLLSVIESVLRSLDVEKLVIPAISELKETWTSVFSFRPLEALSKQKMKNINMMVFPHIQMLEKPMLKLQTAEEKMIVVEGLESTELQEHQSKEEVMCEVAPHGVGINEPVVESSLQIPDGSLKETDGKCLGEFGVPQDNLEDENETIMDPSGSISGLCEQTDKDTTEYKKGSSGLTPPVLDQRVVELSSQSNQRRISEKDSKSFVLCSDSEANECEASVLCASREGTESTGLAVKVENHIATDNLNSYNEGSIHQSTEVNTAEPCEKVFSHEFEVPVRNAVSHYSETTNQISNGDMDFNYRHTKHYRDEKMLEIHEMQNDQSAVEQASATLTEIRSTSIECSGSQTSHTSKVSIEVVHQISTQKTEDDSSQGNGLESREVFVSAPVDTNCDPSCGPFIDSNGLCKSKEVISGRLGVVVDSLQD